MPAYPFIDTHLHVWDPNHLRYPWLDEIPLLNKPYLLEDYDEATEGLSIEKLVFLQCECLPSQCEQEAQWVIELAAKDSRIQGLVPWAPLEKGEEARDIIERFSQIELIKGIRRIIQFEEDQRFCLQPNFVRGVQMLADYDLSFDICISHTQLANTIKLVEQCPHVQFILDHIAKPDIKNGNLDPWRVEVHELAQHQNVFCKISGLATEADRNWKPADLAPYLEHVISSFGEDRIVFGGDWPVVCQASTYKQWVKALDEFLERESASMRKKLYYQNAILFYKLPIDP